jgi:hypothetical protein
MGIAEASYPHTRLEAKQMKCKTCSNETPTPFIVAGLPFCRTCYAELAKLRDIKLPSVAKAKPTSNRSSIDVDERHWWKVQSGDFVCMIHQKDASNESEAIREAENPLTRWYFVGERLNDAMAGFETVSKINHDTYVEWLRNGKFAFSLPTT